MSKARRWFTAGVGVLALTLAVVGQVDAQQTIQWKFQVGQQWQLAIDQQTESLTQVSDQQLKVQVQVSLTEQWRVLSVEENGLATIERALGDIKIVLRSAPDNEINFDSTRQRNAPGAARELGKALGPILKQPMQIQLNPQGAVVNVVLSDKLKANLAEVSGLLGDFFSPQSIKEQLVSLGRLPAGPVTVGDSWSVDVKTPSELGTLSLERTFAYDGQKEVTGGSVSEILVSGTASLQPASKPQGRQVELKQHKLSGVIRFDAARGQLRESEERQTLLMETRYRELKVQSRVTTTIRTKLTPGQE